MPAASRASGRRAPGARRCGSGRWPTATARCCCSTARRPAPRWGPTPGSWGCAGPGDTWCATSGHTAPARPPGPSPPRCRGTGWRCSACARARARTVESAVGVTSNRAPGKRQAVRRLRERLLQSLALAFLGSLIAASPALADPQPFGHECSQENGVRFCPTKSDEDRVPSFDKVPLDVDVTLPDNGDGPWPTIVMMHGWGGDKDEFESDDPDGDGSITYHYNNNFYAKHGFAVVNYSARGFGRSCGNPSSR